MACPTLKRAAGSYGHIRANRPFISASRCSLRTAAFSRPSARMPTTIPPASCAPRIAAWSIPRAPPDITARRAAAMSRPVSSVYSISALIDVPGADDRQAARVQNRGITTTVEDRRSVLSETLLQSLGIAGIGSAHDPDRPRAPALHRLTEKESSAEQPFESRGVRMAPALLQKRVRAAVQQIGRLTVQCSRSRRARRRYSPAVRGSADGLPRPAISGAVSSRIACALGESSSPHQPWLVEARASGHTGAAARCEVEVSRTPRNPSSEPGAEIPARHLQVGASSTARRSSITRLFAVAVVASSLRLGGRVRAMRSISR